MKFLAKHKKQFECVIVSDPPHSAERGRWSDGRYADVCTRHMEIWKKNAAAHRTQQHGKLWFLGKGPGA